MFRVKLLLASLTLGTGPVVLAQDYFDFGQIPGVPDRPAVQVDLDPTLLGFASATARAENPAVADLLLGIEGVQVRVYKELDNIDDLVAFIEEASSRLERDDWRRVVSVEDNGTVRVHFRGEGEVISGVTAMIVHDGEAVFVNVAGSISAEQLAQTVQTIGNGEALASLGILGELDFSE